MHALIKKLISPVYSKYKRHTLRIGALETAVVCLARDNTYEAGAEVGFNGQAGRKKCVEEILGLFSPDGFIETGTWTGNTTGYLRSTFNLPGHTCEINPPLAAVATMRLAGLDRISFHEGDSRGFLRNLAGSSDRPARPFVYLDAHWYEDLPLGEELRILTGAWDDFVVLVDDFEVPGDAGYEYDDYGNGLALDFATFGPIFEELGLVCTIPTIPSSEETGMKRGYIVLCRPKFWEEKLKGLALLKRWPA